MADDRWRTPKVPNPFRPRTLLDTIAWPVDRHTVASRALWGVGALLALPLNIAKIYDADFGAAEWVLGRCGLTGRGDADTIRVHLKGTGRGLTSWQDPRSGELPAHSFWHTSAPSPSGPTPRSWTECQFNAGVSRRVRRSRDGGRPLECSRDRACGVRA